MGGVKLADYIDRYTEAEAKKLEKKIKEVYRQAAKEVKQKFDDFQAGHKVISERMLDKVKRGEITKDDYQKWLRGQVFIGDRWKDKLKDITDVYKNADKKAREMLGGTTKQVFTESANRTAYEMDKELRGAVSFNLYDKNTVNRLIKDNPKMLPEWKINEKKDYIWNEKRVQNAITQGIIQGESVYDIGTRLTKDLSAQNASKMDMFARTAMTGAQNAGRVERLKETEEAGIEVKKKWLAARDNRVRDTHAELDGQERPVNEPFEVDGMRIDYPGDPNAPPELVYNCRCTLVYVYPKYEPKYETHHFDSYKEWKAKQSSKAPKEKTDKTPEKVYDVRAATKKLQQSMPSMEAYEEAVELIEKGETTALYANYADSCAQIVHEKNGGVYLYASDRVEYCLENSAGRSKYTTMAHEMGHMFDAKMGHFNGLTFNEAELINSRCGMTFNMVRIRPSASDQFLEAMRKDATLLEKILSDSDELKAMNTGTWQNSTAGIQDAMDGLFGTQNKGILDWGHGDRYYNKFYNGKIKQFSKEKTLQQVYKELGFDASSQAKTKQIARSYDTASEAWANAVSALTCGGAELEAFEKYMPNTIAAIRKILGGL